jgi:hypothetical protein
MSMIEMPAHESILKLAAYRAALAFGGTDGMFNSACFSDALEKVTGLVNASGAALALMLVGRPWVTRMRDGCHWRLNRDTSVGEEL